ncbi:hypothetical protein VDB37_003509 [Salmonella enterica]|nr:hypothetical protein [Salmonella enterica]ELH0295957.1 hypothetical protein [Salmonella enterica]EMC3488440.1 hypothetical protein [Salmonella enterica]EMD7453452.1 hypothetical protein [Salmonella enterica]EME3455204.1 hypothetical protein [Salmonella enterica]
MMGIYTGEVPHFFSPPDPADIAGRFGAATTGALPLIADINLAPVGPATARGVAEAGYSVVTKNIPPNAQPWGLIVTWSSAGAGADGRRCLTSPLLPGECVFQLYFDTTQQLFTRGGSDTGGFSAWQKQKPR